MNARTITTTAYVAMCSRCQTAGPIRETKPESDKDAEQHNFWMHGEVSNAGVPYSQIAKRYPRGF